MKHWQVLLTVGWLLMASSSVFAGTASDCCVCINCAAGPQCISVMSTTQCVPSICDMNGCPNSQIMGVLGACSNVPQCGAPALPAPAPALSPLAAGAALLGLAALARRTLGRHG
jgi:hypothetical protein